MRSVSVPNEATLKPTCLLKGNLCVKWQRVGWGGRDERARGARCARQAARVDRVDKNKDLPLHWAAYNGHKDVAELLMADFNSVDKNKDVNSVDTGGHTHLRDAMIQKHTKVAKVLLKASGR